MTELQLTAAVVLVVARLRAQFPKLDGAAYVLGLSTVLAITLELLVGWGDASVRVLVLKGIGVAVGASGGMQALAYHAEKSAAATGQAVLESMRPPAMQVPLRTPSGAPPASRGFTNLHVVVSLTIGLLSGLVVVGAIACLHGPVCR